LFSSRHANKKGTFKLDWTERDALGAIAWLVCQRYRVRNKSLHYPKGLSTRVRIRVPIAVQFRARFAAKGRRVLILYHTPITTVCKHISETIDLKFNCNPPLTPNRTPNRTPIRMRICTCKRPPNEVVSQLSVGQMSSNWAHSNRHVMHKIITVSRLVIK
jgi:hypothetical protein